MISPAIENGEVLKLWSCNSVSGGRYVHMKKKKKGEGIN